MRLIVEGSPSLCACPHATSWQDLAGSERQDKTGSQGQTLTEGSQINKRWVAGPCPRMVIPQSLTSGTKALPKREVHLFAPATVWMPLLPLILLRA